MELQTKPDKQMHTDHWQGASIIQRRKVNFALMIHEGWESLIFLVVEIFIPVEIKPNDNQKAIS